MSCRSCNGETGKATKPQKGLRLTRWQKRWHVYSVWVWAPYACFISHVFNIQLLTNPQMYSLSTVCSMSATEHILGVLTFPGKASPFLFLNDSSAFLPLALLGSNLKLPNRGPIMPSLSLWLVLPLRNDRLRGPSTVSSGWWLLCDRANKEHCAGLRYPETTFGCRGPGIRKNGERKASDPHSKVRQAWRPLNNSSFYAPGMPFSSDHNGHMISSSLTVYNLEPWDIRANETNMKINHSWSSWECRVAFIQQSPGSVPCGLFSDQLSKGLIKNTVHTLSSSLFQCLQNSSERKKKMLICLEENACF